MNNCRLSTKFRALTLAALWGPNFKVGFHTVATLKNISNFILLNFQPWTKYVVGVPKTRLLMDTALSLNGGTRDICYNITGWLVQLMKITTF